MSPLLVVRGHDIVTPTGGQPADLVIEGERILELRPLGSTRAEPGMEILEVGRLSVLPGLVDTHVHLNEPGREDWEGLITGTRAAAAGGVTTLVDMPLNCSPVTTTVAALRAKRAVAQEKSIVDIGFWGGLVPGNLEQLEPLAAEGVLGFKCFMVHSGIDEFPAAGERELSEAMPLLAKLGLPLLAHAELDIPPRPDSDPRSHPTWSHSRPPACEVAAAEMLIRLCRETGCRTHIVHVAAAEVLPLIRAAKSEGLPLTAETCPHYLYFAEDTIPAGATEYKCAPPIRGAANREALWEGLRDGTLDLIATDHSPCPPSMKGREAGDFFAAWGGIASLQLGLRAVWTGAGAREFGLTHLARWMASAPARLAGVQNRKGELAPGFDADFVLFDASARSIVSGSSLEHRHPITPYDGMELAGEVKEVWRRGRCIHSGAVGGFATGGGRILTRS